MKSLSKINIWFIILGAALLSIGCKRDLNIEPAPEYSYKVELLPVKKNIQKGDTVTLQFSIVYQSYEGAAFTFRYLQPLGEGKITNSGTLIDMGKEYDIPAGGKVSLKYTSLCEVIQTLEFYFTDKFGASKKHMITFDPQALPDYGFTVKMEPVKSVIRTREQIVLKFTVTPNEPHDEVSYTYRYSLKKGSGEIRVAGLGLLEENQNYDLPQNGNIELKYVSTCHELQKIEVAFENSQGKLVKQIVNFEDMPYPYFGINAPEWVKFPEVGEMRVGILIAITGIEQYDVTDFKFYFKRPDGDGILTMNGITLLQDYFYTVPENGQLSFVYIQQRGSRRDGLEFYIQDTYGNELVHKMIVY